MAQRHLQDLLREEQEPFVLQSFIDERRGQLQRPSSKSHLQLTQRMVPSQSQDHAFLPNVTKSPSFLPSLLDSSSDDKSSSLLEINPRNSPSAPSRITAALLLEAALKQVHKQHQKNNINSKSKSKVKVMVKVGVKSPGFGFFASIMKALVLRKRRFLEKDTVGLDLKEMNEEKSKGFKSEDVRNHPGSDETSEFRCSASSDHSLEDVGGADCCTCSGEQGLTSTPLTFLPALLYSSGDSTPESPPPGRQNREGQLFRSSDDDGRTSTGGEKGVSCREEEKEQLSPVSVLDQDPTTSTEAEEEEGDAVEGHVDSFQHSLAIVQRARKQLLSRIQRLERLAELDPVELDRRVVGEAEEDEWEEEEEEEMGPDVHATAERIRRKRFEGCSREAVESSTIDLMVEMDFRREGDVWRGNKEQVQETATELELAIFGFLVEEVSDDVVVLSRC